MMEDSIKVWISLALVVIIEPGITCASPEQESFVALLHSPQSNDEPATEAESFNFHPYLLYFPSMYAHVKSEDYIDDPSSEAEADGETSDFEGELLQSNKIDVIQIPQAPSLENVKGKATNIGVAHLDPDSEDDDSSDSDSDSNSKESSEESSAKKNHYGCGCLKNNIDGTDSDDDDDDSDEDGPEAIWDHKKKIKMHHLNIVQLGAQFLQDINSGLNLFQIADHALDTLIDDRKHNRSFGAQNLLFFTAALGMTNDLQINPEDYDDQTTPMAIHSNTLTTTKAAVPIKIVDNVQVNTINGHGKSEKEIENFVSVMKVSSPPNKGLEITSFVVGASVTSAFCICMILLWKLSKGQLNLDKRTLIEVK